MAIMGERKNWYINSFKRHPKINQYIEEPSQESKESVVSFFGCYADA